MPQLEPSSKDNERRSGGWSGLVSTALALMALGVPILYLIGLAFDQGYQSTFRVPEVARTSGFYETLTLGFFAVHYAVRFLNDWMREAWYVMAAYAMAAGLLTALALWRGPAWFHQSRRRVQVWAVTHENSAKGIVTFAVSLFVFCLPYIAVALAYVVLSMPLLSYLLGQQVAARNLNRQAQNCEIAAADPNRFHQCVTATMGDKIIRGYLVAATPSYFVITLNGQTRALPIDGWEFEARHPSGKKAALAYK